MEYKNTLNIFNSNFPMKANLRSKEAEFLKLWGELNIAKLVRQKNRHGKQFILHDGPPYANGDLHVGHAFNKILKDIIIRYYNNEGYNAPFICGWDTHGLPIEVAVSKQGSDRDSLSISEFRKLCSEYADAQINNQISQFQQLGLLTDFNDKYVTKDWNYELGQLNIFAKMVDRKLIYRDLKPVHWSPSSQSALAEAEIEYSDLKTASIYVAFDLINNNQYKSLKLPNGASLIVWTTTPWTIACNQLLAVSPTIIYQLICVGGKHYIMAEDLVDKVAADLKWENCTKIKLIPGIGLLNMTYKHPLYNRTSKVVSGHHVTTDTGTGIVHIASGFGEDDYEIARANKLDVWAPMDDYGHFTDGIKDPNLIGKFYLGANKIIAAELENNGHLIYLTFIKHSAPIDWRTGKPVIYRATKQWFVNITKLKPRLKNAIKDVEWYPTWCQKKMISMIEKRNDWCISRQRSWGIPIIAFYDKEGNLQLNNHIVEHVIKKFEVDKSMESWFTDSADVFLPANYQNLGWTKEQDILDVWLDSGASSSIVLPEKGLHSPADLYLEGNDQFRGWFNSSLIINVINSGDAPYAKVATHGFVNDGKGRKMSKSKDNFISLKDFSKNNSIDLLRLWVASTDFTSDVKFSNDIMKQIGEEYRRIRNTIRFLINNLVDFNYDRNFTTDIDEVDQFIINRVLEFEKKVTEAYKGLNFKKVTVAINHLINHYLSNFYLDFAKDILYIDSPNSPRRRKVQSTLYVILQSLIHAIKPILVFTSEEIHRVISDSQESVHLTPNFKIPFHFNRHIEDNWELIMTFRKDVNLALEKARVNKIINKSLEADIIVSLKPNYLKIIDYNDFIQEYFILGGIKFVDAVDEGDCYDTSCIKILALKGNKCVRCWKIKPGLSTRAVCSRCEAIVSQLADGQ